MPCNTSRLFGIGKGVALKQLRNGDIQAVVFSRKSVSAKEIAVAGERELVNFYRGSKKRNKLDGIRFQKFVKK